MLFDTHCHLTSKRLHKQLEGVLSRASEVGVGYIVVPGTNLEDSKKAIEIVEQFDGGYGVVGVHPEGIVEISGEADFFELEKLLCFPKVVGIGEVGLDGTVTVAMDVQKQVLKRQINLAIDQRKSLVLHSRGTADVVLKVLDEVWSPVLSGKTVFHCCEVDRSLLRFAQERLVYIGVDGDVTYNEQKQEFINNVPLELLVLETDAPYLLPEPLLSVKQYPNEPGYLRIIAEKVAEIKGMSVDELEKITFENGMKLFGIESI